MNLPTANEIICEYSRAGLRPTSRTVCYEPDGKCCAIGVLERSEPKGSRVETFEERFRLTRTEALTFARGFDDGFEGKTYRFSEADTHARREPFPEGYDRGLEIGRKVRLAFPEASW